MSKAGAEASRSSQSNSQRRQRSRSTSRYADLDKPKKKRPLSGTTTSLVSIPNTIKLQMLNSGLLSFERIKEEARDENNSLSTAIPDKPISLKLFLKLCEQRRKFPVLYKLEFQAVKVESNSCKHASRRNNQEKNQNQKCIPYDYNRVILEKINGIPDSDYINASYVDSLLKPNAYIVTQGPTEETVTDFWRLVWQENVSAIIMLTKTFDFTKVMCVQYWPASKEKDESYGDLWIGIAKEEQLANFQIRTFHLYKKDLNGHIQEERNILQFHFCEWHSHSVPFPNAVLEFRRRVRAVVGNIIKSHSIAGPMLVHCNDGGGRSGVYLAIDANLELAEEEETFHLFGYLKKLKQSRRGLIENVDQYKFVYDTLEEHLTCGKSWFSVSELSDKLKQKAQKDHTKMNEYQREYAQICKQTPRFTIGDCAGGHRADNRDKNRDVLCVPPDNFRPYLTSFQGNAFTDYINAVFVDGYTKPREYIVTEWPLHKTLGEFWSLVYDQECSAVVVICNPPPNSQQFPQFWPEKRRSSQKFGPVFTVTCKNSKHYTNIKTWEFSINKKIVSLTELMAGVKAPVRNVQLFQLTCWPMGHKVPTSTNSLVELMNMVEQWREKVEYGPVCVVSPDGRSRAGVYCAANACIEQVIQHQEVDIFQAVKTVRRHRPQLIENITEYKYCYDLALHYVLHYLNKDLKEKKFIEFGRGKVIPLTPEKADLATEISNIGRIVVNKCIEKIEKVDTNASLLFGPYELMNIGGSSGAAGPNNNNNKSPFKRQPGQLSSLPSGEGRTLQGQQLPHKKKRLYSLGGNEPIRLHRARLNRLKTVGTFDLTIEEVPRGEAAAAAGDESALATASTSTEIFTASSNVNSSSSCLNSPKELQQMRRTRGVRGGKLARQIDCGLATTSSESFDKVGSGIGGRRGTSIATTTTSSSLDTKTHSTDDDDQVTMISNRGVFRGGTRSSAATDSDNVKSPDDVFAKTKSILSNSSDFKARKSTFKKSKRITRTDSELQQDDDVYEKSRGSSLAKCSTDSNDSVLSPAVNYSTDAMHVAEEEQDEQADRFSLQGGTASLQREYKSDGNSLDEVGLQRDSKEMPPPHYSLDNCLMSTSSMDYIRPKRGSSVDSARGKSETPPAVAGKIFENPFAKFKKINKVWKGKKFSISSGNVRGGSGGKKDVLSPTEGDREVQEIISPVSVVSDSPKVTLSSSSIFSKIRQQATATSSPSSSVASSRSHPRRLFSRLTSISNTELYKTGATRGTRSQGKDISKSNSEINALAAAAMSPFRKKDTVKCHRQKSVKSLKLEKMKNNSAGCLADRKMAITTEGVQNATKVQSPLSEEFYNKTGSVRLSAVELFEKFCSSDFSGLYKHEDQIDAMPGHLRGAPAKRFIYRKNSKLLKQRSEPRFTLSMHQQQFRFDDAMLNETYYEEEGGGIYDDDEDKEMEEGEEEQLGDEEDEVGEEYEYYEGCEYEEEMGDEEEEVEDEEHEHEGDEHQDEAERRGTVRTSGVCGESNLKALQEDQVEEDGEDEEDGAKELDLDVRRDLFGKLRIGHRVTEEDEEGSSVETSGGGQEQVTRRHSSNHENMFIFEHSNADQEVDEIILMPETTCIAAAYPSLATTGTAPKRVHLHRTEVIYDLNNLNSDENVTSSSNALLLSVIKDYVRNSGGETGEAEISLLDNCRDFEVKSVNNEDILTIYRICSEENLTVTRSHMSSSKSDTQFVNRRSFQSSLKTPRSSYKKHRKHSQASSTRSGPTPLVTVELEEGGEYLMRSGSNDSDLGDMEEDTVRFLCPDSFGSKLSLSLFDDLSLNFSLTLNDHAATKNDDGDGRKLLAPDCDAEDFNLTSEGSVSECIDAQIERPVESLPSDCGSSENNTMNDEAVAGVLGSPESIPKGQEETEEITEFVKGDREEEEVVPGNEPSKLGSSRSAKSDSNEDDEEKKDAEKETPLNEVMVAALIENLLEGTDSLSVDEDDTDDPNKVSRFTNELQKEFDMLFDIAATKPNVELEVGDFNQIEPHSGHGSMKMHKSSSGYSHQHHQHQHHGSSLIASIRTRISSRHSMQNLEPYEPMNGNAAGDNPGGSVEHHSQPPASAGQIMSKSVDQLHHNDLRDDDEPSLVLHSKKGLLSIAASQAAKYKSKSSLQDNNNNNNNNSSSSGSTNSGRKSRKTVVSPNVVNEDDSEIHGFGCVHLLCSRFKKRKSLSVGHIEKSKCFPL